MQQIVRKSKVTCKIHATRNYVERFSFPRTDQSEMKRGKIRIKNLRPTLLRYKFDWPRSVSLCQPVDPKGVECNGKPFYNVVEHDKIMGNKVRMYVDKDEFTFFSLFYRTKLEKSDLFDTNSREAIRIVLFWSLVDWGTEKKVILNRRNVYR